MASKANPRSFDRLDALLSAQPYRLAYWRVAAEEINYRRFFDINDLAAIRMEDPEVFERTHAFAFELLRDGCIDGIRIDHVDGLYDPGDYLERLQTRAREVRPDLFSDDRRLYLVVEKILGLDEWLPSWPVEGTTGYEFLVRVNGLFVDGRNERAVNDAFERFTRLRTPFREFAYRSKQLILRMSMASELKVLAHRPEPVFRTEPPFPRLHPESSCVRDARDHRVVPGVPHVRERAGAGRERARSPLHRARRQRSQAPQSAAPRRRIRFHSRLVIEKGGLHPGGRAWRTSEVRRASSSR